MYGDYEIRNIPLTFKPARLRVEQFLHACGLRLDDVDDYAVVTHPDDDRILAGGGLRNNVVKCLAVSDELRGTGMMQTLISHLINMARERGHQQVRVFTKPENQDIFESLGFKVIAVAPKAIFMENAMGGIEEYCSYLRGLRREGHNGMIVINANPFTLGHKALVEYASSQVETLYIIVVKEDCSHFSYSSRLLMIQAGCAHIGNVVVCEGSDYAISATTFPTYFLKQLSDASDTQITLDLDLCGRHLAPALGAVVRFVGSEPTDKLTARYVELMQTILPTYGVDVNVMTRVNHDGMPVSASKVRKNLSDGQFAHAALLVPPTTIPYLISDLASRALLLELNTTPKPGLVDKHDNGAHVDMNYGTMLQSISALSSSFDQLALIHDFPSTERLQAIGVEMERRMLHATNGVNTHRGAIFSLGLAVVATSIVWNRHQWLNGDAISQTIQELTKGFVPNGESHGIKAVALHRVDGALAVAQKGYRQLFDSWLPFYDSLQGDDYQCHKTLLHIMTTLDDTNVLHRAGFELAQEVKKQAEQLLDNFSESGLQALNEQFIQQNISPGGAADMLSLTIYIHSITH